MLPDNISARILHFCQLLIKREKMRLGLVIQSCLFV